MWKYVEIFAFAICYKKPHKPSSFSSLQYIQFFFVFPLCNLSHSTYPHIRACNTRCKCYLHSHKRVDLPLDYVRMNEQRAQKLACLHFPAMSPLSITSAYLASLTPLDRRTLNKAVAAVYIAVNIISSQSGRTAYIGGRE